MAAAYPGHRIIGVSWAANALFAVTAIPAALGASALEPPAIAVALGLFALAITVWLWAFGIALSRTTRGDDVVVGSLFLMEGPVPRRVRWNLYGSLAAAIAIAAATAVNEPFGTLAPMLPLGLAGLWGARYGTFPPRPATPGGRAAASGGARHRDDAPSGRLP